MKKGWEVKKLGEVAKYFIGLTYSPKDICDDGTVVLRSSNIQNGKLDFTDIVRVKSKIKESLYVQDGDILMCSRNGSKSLVGKTATINGLNEKMTYGTFMTVIRSPYNAYLAYFFKSDFFKNQINKGENPVINQITKYMLDDLSVPLPPLSEQKRIVSILDRAFAAIDKAKANTEKNLQNAKELFESYLQGIFSQHHGLNGLKDSTEKKSVQSAQSGKISDSDKWEEKKIKDIADVEYGFTDKASEKGVYRYIRITDIDRNGELIVDDKVYIKGSKETMPFILRENDLLMARTGATFGKVLLYKEYEPSVFASYLIRIKFTHPIENELYWFFTKTKMYWQQANRLSSGSAQPQFNGAALKEVIFPYPKSLSKQKKLIGKFKALLVETQKLEIHYRQKLDSLDELKKSILQKAFAGELKTATQYEEDLPALSLAAEPEVRYQRADKTKVRK